MLKKNPLYFLCIWPKVGWFPSLSLALMEKEPMYIQNIKGGYNLLHFHCPQNLPLISAQMSFSPSSFILYLLLLFITSPKSSFIVILIVFGPSFIFFFYFYFFSGLLLRHMEAKGRIGAVSTGLHHSQSNARSFICDLNHS